MRRAAEEGESVDEVVTEFSRRRVEPALAELDEELHTLGARPALLRVSSNPATVAAAGATVAIVAAASQGLVGLGPAAPGLAAPLLAAAASELKYRLEKHRELAAKPFWLLHDAALRRR